MAKPLLALSIVALVATCLAIAPHHARASKPCTTSCNIADHMTMHHSMGSPGTPMHGMVAMVNMPGMGSAAPTPAPVGTAQPQQEPRGAAADAMMQSMNDDRMSHGGHMTMTMARAATPEEKQRAAAILSALRQAIEPFKDYRTAQAAGYKQFLPQLPQPIYHFTSWTNAFANEFSFDPARPTSLMYKAVPGGFELVGAMYTAPARFSNAQLNERVPLSVGTWHLHTNLCLPPADKRAEMWGPHPQFGLAGSITSADACTAAGGTFKPVIYNWMLHVWPLDSDPSKVWATEEHPGAMNR
jgi:hypothetical protein